MSRLLRSIVGTVLIALAAVGVPAVATAAGRPSAPVGQAFLAGELGYEGGAAPGGFHPTAGTVVIRFALDPLVLATRVGSSGHFRIPLAPGTYEVNGCGPASTATSTPRCGALTTVTLTAGEVDHIRLVWLLAP
jgi:hypothetical protein